MEHPDLESTIHSLIANNDDGGGGGENVSRRNHHASLETEDGDRASHRPMVPPSRCCNYSYLSSADFIEFCACLVFFGVCLIPLVVNIAPHQRPIPFQFLDNSNEYVINLSYNEEFDGDTVSDGLNVFLAGVLPLLIQFSSSKLWGPVGDGHGTFCAYLTAFGLNLLSTHLIKNYVGYLRPSFYELCQPKSQDYQECTQPEGDGEETRKSFPSGHASTAFTGLTLLSLFLHTRFGVPSIQLRRSTTTAAAAAAAAAAATSTTTVGGEEDGDDGRQRWRRYYSKPPFRYRCLSVLSLAPLALALFIAASRVVDNRHFPADVVGGAVLGGSIAVFVHGLWF
jgi:membrane-associated phospholipid phosphatase